MTYIAGIDYGIRNPCMCLVPYSDSNELTPFEDCHWFYTTEVKSHVINQGNIHSVHMLQEGEQRYSTIAEYFVEQLKAYKVTQVGLEGYAFGAKGSSLTALAENCGLLKYFLSESCIAVNVHAPTSVKKFATGSGKASKDDMYDLFALSTGVELNAIFGRSEGSKSPVSDMVDAYYISQFQRFVRILEEAR